MKTIDKRALDRLKILDDEYVKRETDDEPLSIDQKIDFLRESLGNLNGALDKNGNHLLEERTIQIYESRLKYWESKKAAGATTKPGGRDVQKIIDEIANRISSKKSGGWKSETISGFLTAYNKNNDASVSDLREIAIENAIDENIKGELAEVPQSTLYDWREKLDD